MPLLHFYKWALSVAAAESHPHHAERDARDIIKVSPKHAGSVCIPVTESITHKHKQMFFMWSRVNLLTSAVVCNTVCVNQHLQRWGSYPFVIPWFVFLSWHSVLHSLPGITRNVLSSSVSPGSLSQHGGLPQKYAEASTENLPQNDDLFTQKKAFDIRRCENCLSPFLLNFSISSHLSFLYLLILSPGGPKEEV